MNRIKLVTRFFTTSVQEEMAYRANFYIHLLHSLLRLLTGVGGLWVVYSQIESLQGWDFPSLLALLGVYLLLDALRAFFISPSLDVLVGPEGEVGDGRFDFTLLRPLDVQFAVSLRHWRLFSLLDAGLALAVLGSGVVQMGHTLPLRSWLAFLIGLSAALITIYAILLAFSAMAFWSPGFMFNWVFDSLFQAARYPVEMYPGQLRLLLTWVIPLGVMTTVPARALNGTLSPFILAGSLALSLLLLALASLLFRRGLRRYASASS